MGLRGTARRGARISRGIALAALVAVAPAGCGRIEYQHGGGPDGGDAALGPDSGDAALGSDGGDAALGSDGGRACTWSTFSAPMRISELSTVDDDRDPSISLDGRTIFYASLSPAPSIYSALRTDVGAPFGAPTRQVGLDDPAGGRPSMPTLTADGLQTIYWLDTVAGGDELRIADRPSATALFGTSRIAEIEVPQDANGPFLLDDLTLVYVIIEPVAGVVGDLAIARRASRSGGLVRERYLTELNTTQSEEDPTLTRDGLEIVFASDRLGQRTLFSARRDSITEPFEAPDVIAELHDPTATTDGPELSADGATLYFASDRAGSIGQRDLWYSTRECLP